MATLSPNMNLLLPTVGTDSGLIWEQSLDSDLSIIDSHDHSPGKGVPINSGSINITGDFSLNNNNLVQARSLRLFPQPAALSLPTDLGCLYESGVDLFYNDGNGNQIQITSGGAVNATSSGISSGTATASFVSSVLVVNADVNKPANIQGGSILLGNNVTNSKFVTLSPTNSLASNYGLVLPLLPPGQQIMTLDASGNITAPYTVDNSTITISSNVIGVPASGIGTSQLANSSVTNLKLAPVNIVLSSSFNSTFAVSSTITTASITTVGRPVLITFQSTLGQLGRFFASSSVGVLILKVGSTTLASWDFGTSPLPPGGLSFTDTTGSSSGTYAYSLVVGGSVSVSFGDCQMVLREL